MEVISLQEGYPASQTDAALDQIAWENKNLEMAAEFRDADGKPPQHRLADAYAALGVTPQTDAAGIKRAYRKLISQNHPDKLASRGLPETMRAVAEERSREINSAYDLIKSARSDIK